MNSKIKRWIIIGAETDVCVYQTAKELLKLNMQVTLVREAIYSGRNNTEITINNLKKFGAHFISIKELFANKNLFITTKPKVENTFDFQNTVLTVYPSTNAAGENGDAKRLAYLQQYAKIIGLNVESPNAVTKKYKTRLIAGDVTKEIVDELKKQNKEEIILVADCTPQMNTKDIPSEWRVHTLKMVFYELMGTAEFYAKSVDELSGWQKELQKALLGEKLGYVESLQNE